MPGFYQEGEYDVSGTIVGVVEKDRMLDGRGIRPGDAVLGLASSGLHTNGYSLARDILFKRMKLKPTSHLPELARPLGEELLQVHRSYSPLIQTLLKKFNAASDKPKTARKPSLIIKALAHITGGGFVDNIPRVLPDRCDVLIRKSSWQIPTIFQLLRKHGRLDEAELYQVFNMGIGMVLVVSAESADAVLKAVQRQGHTGWRIGEVASGTGKVRLV